MKRVTIQWYIGLVLCFLCLTHNTYGQRRGYAADSIQIKIYIEIEYINNQPKELKIKKVFCDYCSTKQIEYIKKIALKKFSEERYNPAHRVKNGKAKLTLNIRFSKQVLIELKDD